LSAIYNFSQFLSGNSDKLETLLLDSDLPSHRIRTISLSINEVTQKLTQFARTLQKKLPYSLESDSIPEEPPAQQPRVFSVEKPNHRNEKLRSFQAVASFYIRTFSFHGLLKSLSSCGQCVISIDHSSMKSDDTNGMEKKVDDFSGDDEVGLDDFAPPVSKKRRRNSRRYPIMRSQNQVIDDWLREDRYDESFRDLESFIVPG
jgi:hypothetical protein